MASLVLFYISATLCLGGAILVVSTNNIVHAAFALLLSLISVAGLYLLLFSPFLSLVQVLVYGGAITIVIMFAIMLTKIEDFKGKTTNKMWPLAIVSAAAIFIILVTTFILEHPESTQVQQISFRQLGSILFTQWAVPFEIASLVLLTALIGAIILARDDDGAKE